MNTCWLLLIFYEQELLVARCFSNKQLACRYFRSYMATQYDEEEDFGYERGDAADTMERNLAWTGRTEKENIQIEATLLHSDVDVSFDGDAETMTEAQRQCHDFAHFGQFCSNRF